MTIAAGPRDHLPDPSRSSVVGCRRNEQTRADAPDQLARLRRNESLVVEITQAGLAPLLGSAFALVHKGQDAAVDQQDVLTEAERIDRLQREVVDESILRAGTHLEVVLHGQ